MRKETNLQIITILLLSFGCTSCSWTQSAYKPCEGTLMTRWANDVTATNAHTEYPRPQMVRDDWLNLNGLWDYAITAKDASKPEQFDGQILVPFCVESALSGVMKRVGEENRLWYRRTFEIPDGWADRKVLLHFGAVDWEATIWVNGQRIGTHRGGYDPFTFDITEALTEDQPQQITLAIWDPTNAGFQPCGKQMNNNHGIFYTPVTGIWQTVWLEPVRKAHIKSLKLLPQFDESSIKIEALVHGAGAAYELRFEASDGSKPLAHHSVEAIGGSSTWMVPFAAAAELHIPQARAWTPDSPFLYDLQVTLLENGNVVDRVNSYFGMRKISLGKDDKGITRLFLNNKPLFHFGPLDQGWWPDGLYTAPTDEALKYDIEVTKKLGFNMARKHVKVEPQRWYYWADKLGLLVWQDMPNGDKHIRQNEPDYTRSAESAAQFESELRNIIDTLYNHPSIVMWVPFNEGWGQYDTQRITNWIKQCDPTRLVNSASGWADRGAGDVHDIHSYPGPAAPPNEENRAAVLGEFGGLGLPLKGHTWQGVQGWGYHTLHSKELLYKAYSSLLNRLGPLIESGLAAAVYTQTTDVETEVNGLMTYDRQITKMEAGQLAELNGGIISKVR